MEHAIDGKAVIHLARSMTKCILMQSSLLYINRIVSAHLTQIKMLRYDFRVFVSVIIRNSLAGKFALPSQHFK
ncbi:hypothetical protein EBQ26_05925 [Allofranklinella schreckenbergeri]|uniref:Uncharacterized protein n=1 Tax=Allofranklinella schreckenbergeri TaxID=1076744 RepID=A0A3M6Q8W9_9BURK|nr:hypothetical protein EBQ26_05925 [Allofranklinella schreckenbergeri]